MSRKQIVEAAVSALVVLAVFAWSVIMAAMGYATFIAGLAPVLGLTVIQVLREYRSRTAPASGHRVMAVPDKEGHAP